MFFTRRGKILLCFILAGFFGIAGCYPNRLIEQTQPVRSYTGPIVDAHSHPRKRHIHALQRHFGELAHSGVKRMIVMTTPNDYRKKKRLEVLERSTNFQNVSILCTANFVGFAYQGQLETAKSIVDGIARDLRQKKCIGIGEVGLRHFNKRRDGTQHVVTMSLDHELVHEILSIANTYSVPIVFHIETNNKDVGIDRTPEISAWYRRICARYPSARLIASHTGMMSPSNLAKIFQACPNVFADFKVLHTDGALFGFSKLFAVNDSYDGFLGHWAQLFKNYPERIIFGSDWKDQRRRGYANYDYGEHIAMVRRMIGSFPVNIQEKIAYKNAMRVFNLQEN